MVPCLSRGDTAHPESWPNLSQTKSLPVLARFADQLVRQNWGVGAGRKCVQSYVYMHIMWPNGILHAGWGICVRDSASVNRGFYAKLP